MLDYCGSYKLFGMQSTGLIELLTFSVPLVPRDCSRNIV